MSFRNSDSKESFIQELVTVWEDTIRVVYLKEPPVGVAKREAEEAWLHTGMTPLEYTKFVVDPRKATNCIGRGQKAREKRWKSWIKYQESFESFRCMDCDVNTHTINEYYMVKNDIWNNVVKSRTELVNLHKLDENGEVVNNLTTIHVHEGMLCIGCLEKRIGRKLINVDFPDYPVNSDANCERSDRLQSRLNNT